MSDRVLFGRELPESWELLTIGDVASVVGGSTPKSKEPSYWGGDISWLGVADLTGYSEKRISHGERSITQAGYDSCPTQMLPKDSIVFSSRAPIGYVAIADNPLCTSQGFKSLVLPPSLSPDYVYWWLKASKPLAEALASGTTFKEISGKGTARIPFPLPPRAEQDRIVEAVESAMASIDGGMQSLTTAEREIDRLELAVLAAGFENRLLRSKEPPLMDSWPMMSIGEVTTHVLGKMLDKSKNKGTLRPYLRNINVQWDGISTADLKEMRIRDAEVDRYRVEHGDLLVCEGGEPGRCAVWEGDEQIFFQKALHRVRSKGDTVNPYFLAHYLRFATRRGWLDRYFTGSTIKHLPGERLAEVPMPVAPRSEQDRIVNAVDRAMTRIYDARAAVTERHFEVEVLRRSVLHRAFSGRLVTQDLADEPASELLERIKAEKAEREAELKAAKRRTRKQTAAKKRLATPTPTGAERP